MSRDDLHAEIAELRAERDYWKAAHDDLKAAAMGTGDDLGIRLGTSITETRIIKLLMSGRAYQKEDICGLCLKDGTEPSTVIVHICQIRKKVPWLKFISKPGSNSGYALHSETIARIKTILAEMNA